jgi:hypothetical protein
VTLEALVFQTFAPFIQWPLAAFIPAGLFGAGFAWNRRALTLAAAIAWALYATLETLNKARITCSGECNIRVDLLVIYPFLWIVSIAGIAALVMGRSRRGAA